MSNGQKSATSPAIIVAGGAAVAALAGFAVITLSARFLTTEQNSAFMVFWSATFTLVGVLSGIQNETTRAVRADRIIEGDGRATSPIKVGLLVGVLSAAVVLILFPLWAHSFASLGNVWLPIILMAATAVFYSGQVSAVGIMAGRDKWGTFATMTAAESLVRLTGALLAAFFGWSTSGFIVATMAGTTAWVVLSFLPRARMMWHVQISLGRGPLLRRIALAMAAAGANAILVNGFPLLMSLTTDKAVYAASAPLVVAVSVTRAPLLMPIVAFQSLVIASFVDHPERARSSLIKLVTGIFAVAIVGGILAALVGPWLMRLVFGPDYGNSAVILGFLVVDAAMLAMLVLGGAVALALDQHRANMIGWYVAALVAIVIMLLPMGLPLRTILALSIGPIAGSAIHLHAVMRVLDRIGDGK